MPLRRTLAVLAVTAALAGCGGSSGGSAAPPSPSPTVDTVAADKAAVTATWEGFFDGSAPVDSHIALLEDGAKFRPELTAQAKDPTNAPLRAKVTDVVVSGTSATVTYDLTSKGGVVLLGGSTGEAVKVGGKWLVSKKTYCALVTLQDSSVAHPGCS
jgi:hypothetical protein